MLPAEPQAVAIELDLDALVQTIDLPGGVTIPLKFDPGSIPDLGNEVMKLLAEGNAALAPLAPIFTVIGAVLAVFDCIKAIPATIGPPPDPTALAGAIAKAVGKVEALLKLVPQLSVPFVVRSLLGTLVAGLKGVRAKLAVVLKSHVRINAGLALQIPGVNLARLQANLNVAKSNLDAQMAAMTAALGPLNKVLCLLNLFFSLIGGAEIAPFSFDVSLVVPDLTSKVEAGVDISLAIDEVLEPFDAIIKLLDGIYLAIALPGPSGAQC
jgi:hypothetical protein